MRRTAAPLFALVAACATTAPAVGPQGPYQADHKDPAHAAEVDDGAGNALVSDALARFERAQRAHQAGNEDQARAEGKACADLLVSFVDKYPDNRYRLVLLRMAAQAELDAREWEAAARVAARLGADAVSGDTSKAIAARLGATAWQQAAIQDMRAGKIPPLQLVGFEARKGAEVKPQAPARPWAAFVEEVDRYARLASDPAVVTALGGTPDLGQLELVAAQVEFGYDNMEQARRRFWALIQAYPGQADVMESAVPYYLETFRVLKDDPGYDDALAKLQPIVAGEAKRARDAASAPGAGEAQKKAAATFAKLDDDLTRRLKGADYSAAASLLRKGEAADKAGKPAEGAARYREAAALFEKFAAENKDSPDAPNALYNAAVAWDKAKDNRKAVAERERLVALYPDAKIVPQALLRLGVGLALDGNNAGAAKAYESYLSRSPDGPQHCIALQNLGVALQNLGKKPEATQRYEQFAADASCVKEDPNNAARVLYEAGKLLVESKRPQDARKVFQELADLEGVSGTAEKAYQADARERLAKAK